MKSKIVSLSRNHSELFFVLAILFSNAFFFSNTFFSNAFAEDKAHIEDYRYHQGVKPDPFVQMSLTLPEPEKGAANKLQQFDVEQFTLVGVVVGREISALVMAPGSKEAIVAHIGDKIGRRKGRIIEISRRKLTARELKEGNPEAGSKQELVNKTIELLSPDDRAKREKDSSQYSALMPPRLEMTDQVGPNALDPRANFVLPGDNTINYNFDAQKPGMSVDPNARAGAQGYNGQIGGPANGLTGSANNTYVPQGARNSFAPNSPGGASGFNSTPASSQYQNSQPQNSQQINSQQQNNPTDYRGTYAAPPAQALPTGGTQLGVPQGSSPIYNPNPVSGQQTAPSNLNRGR